MNDPRNPTLFLIRFNPERISGLNLSRGAKRLRDLVYTARPSRQDQNLF
jgi:hypothetical protein